MKNSTPYSRPEERRIALALVLFLLVVYLTTSALRFHSIDEVAVFSAARSLVGHRTLDSDVIFWVRAPLGRGSIVAQGVDGHTYSVKDVGPSLLAAPLVWSAHRLGISPVRAALLLSPLVSALTGGLVYLVIRSWGYGKTAGALGALTFGLATMAWPYAETLFTQPLAALGLLLALSGAIRAYERDDWRAALWGGLGLGLAGVSAVPVWVSGPVYLLYLIPWESVRSAPWREVLKKLLRLATGFGMGAGLFAASQAIYNLMRFGSPLETGYQQVGASGIRWLYLGLGSFGQLFSAPRGVLWYAPFVVLVPVGVAIGWRNHRRPLLLAIGQIGVIFLLYSSYATWWAGLSWGPRFLVALMPTLTLLIAPLLDRLARPSPSWARILTGGVLLLSVGTQLLASTFDRLEAEIPISSALGSITPPSRLITYHPVLTDPDALPLVRQVASAREGQWDVLWMSRGYFDWPLLMGQLAVLALGAVWLILALKRRRSHVVRFGLIVQAGLSVALAAFMLSRYPQGPNEVSGLDDFIAELSPRLQSGDGIIALLPYSYFAWIDSYDSTTPDIGMVFENPLSSESERMLARTIGWHNRIWLVSEGITSGDPVSGLERWLAGRGFIGPETWVEGFRMTPYTFPPDRVTLRPARQTFGDSEIELVGFAFEWERHPDGGWVNVWLRWEALVQPIESYTVFVHLLDSGGALVAQHDGQPMAGYAPTQTWIPGRPVDDRHSVMLSPALPPGEYRLTIGLYDPLSAERLPLMGGEGDVFLLDVLDVENCEEE